MKHLYYLALILFVAAYYHKAIALKQLNQLEAACAAAKLALENAQKGYIKTDGY